MSESNPDLAAKPKSRVATFIVAFLSFTIAAFLFSHRGGDSSTVWTLEQIAADANYKRIVECVKAEGAIAEELGKPLEISDPPTGSITTSMKTGGVQTGAGSVAITIKGPKGKGFADVGVTIENGRWHVLNVYFSNGIKTTKLDDAPYNK